MNCFNLQAYLIKAWQSKVWWNTGVCYIIYYKLIVVSQPTRIILNSKIPSNTWTIINQSVILLNMATFSKGPGC